MMVTRRTTLKVLGSGATVAAAGIGAPAILRAADKVKIGFLSALTGLETILGETQLNCFKLAVDEINAGGGAGGREIEYVVEDDQTTTKGAIGCRCAGTGSSAASWRAGSRRSGSGTT